MSMTEGGKMVTARNLLFLSVAIAFVPQELSANVRENQFAAGTVSAALGGTGIAGLNNPAATYLNPAALARCYRNQVELGIKFLSTQFTVTGSANAVDQLGDLLVSEIGACLTPLSGLGFGMWASTGISKPLAIELTTQNENITFSRFGKDLSSPTMMLGVGYGFLPELSLGFGFSLAMHSEVSQDVYAPLTNSAKPFFTGLSARVRPRGSVVAGLLVQPIDFIELGAKFQTANFGIFNVNASTKSAAFGFDIPAIIVALEGVSDYSPRQYGFGVNVKPWDSLKILADLSYALWSDYSGPFLVASPDPNSAISSGIKLPVLENYSFRDIFIPKIGLEWNFSELSSLRAGYSFHPAIIEVPKGKTNLIDTDNHNVSIGSGFHAQWGMVAYHVDIFVGLQLLAKNTVQKSVDYGAEAYTFSGIAGSSGLSAGLEF